MGSYSLLISSCLFTLNIYFELLSKGENRKDERCHTWKKGKHSGRPAERQQLLTGLVCS